MKIEIRTGRSFIVSVSYNYKVRRFSAPYIVNSRAKKKERKQSLFLLHWHNLTRRSDTASGLFSRDAHVDSKTLAFARGSKRETEEENAHRCIASALSPRDEDSRPPLDAQREAGNERLSQYYGAEVQSWNSQQLPPANVVVTKEDYTAEKCP